MQCIENTKISTTTTTTTTTNILSVFSQESNTYMKLLYSSDYYNSLSAESEEDSGCVWRRAKLSPFDFTIYAFVVPALAFFGLCANFINAIVFMRPKMTPSAFTYLAALAWLDCVSCVLITLTALSRSFLYSSTFWTAYDFQWQTPLFGITTGAANITLACVSLDRFIYLRWGIPKGTPKFCKRPVARSMVFGSILIAIIVNLPYFFVFVVNPDGSFQTTVFYFSRLYMIHNWFAFGLLTILPAVFLLIGNTAILIAFCKWTKQGKLCQQRCPNAAATNQKRFRRQMKLTVTIVIVISLYLVGELPAHLTSRKSAVNLLYGGDVSKVNFQKMERLEVICITLNAIQLSTNIIVYAAINPTFVPEFFECLKGASDMCFRFTGIAVLNRCCGKQCRKKLQKTSECERNADVAGQPVSGDLWQCDSNNAAATNAAEERDPEAVRQISVITLPEGPTAFVNLAFSKEIA